MSESSGGKACRGIVRTDKETGRTRESDRQEIGGFLKKPISIMQTEMSKDEISFKKFYEGNFNRLCVYFSSRLPVGECAEDMAQEAFMKLLENRIEINNHSCCLLYAIARNLVVDSIRKYYRRENLETVISERMPLSAYLVDDEVHYHELERNFMREISKLSPQRQIIYRKVELEDRAAGDVAEEMRLGLRTVNNQLYMARRIIRCSLQAIG